MNLLDFFKAKEVIRDGNFKTLGNVDSLTPDTLVYCDTVFYVEKADKNDKVSCIISKPEYVNRINSGKGIIISENPRNAFFKLHRKLMENNLVSVKMDYGVGKECKIHPSAIISVKSKIGNNVEISENVVIKDNVEIGDNSFIDCGVVIGAEGLLYIIEGKSKSFVRHAGGIKIGSNVTLLSKAVIVKSVHDSLLTAIGDNSIIGIASNVGHEVQIGKNCIVSNNCVIARYAVLEDNVLISSSAVIREYVKIGENAQVKAGSIVIEDVESNQAVSGNFAVDHRKNLLRHLKSQRSL